MKIYYFEKKRVEADLDGQAIRDYEKHYGKLLKVIINGHDIVDCDYHPLQKEFEEIERFKCTKSEQT